MTTHVFGLSWTRALIAGAERISTPAWPADEEWILVMIALEAAGTWSTDVLQGRANIVPASGPTDMRAEVAGMRGMRLSGGNGARGLCQRMARREKRPGLPDLVHLYAERDPVKQLTDGVGFWLRYKGGGFRCREALYCANLAPARLLGDYDDETILYSANPEDEPLNSMGAAFTKTFWPRAYRDNAHAFGLDPADPLGRLRMKHLSVGLDAARYQSRARIDAELAAVRALKCELAPIVPSVDPPDMRDPTLSELAFPGGRLGR